MTYRNPSCVNFPISPRNDIDVGPLLGTASGPHGLEAEKKEDRDEKNQEEVEVLERSEEEKEPDVAEDIGGEEMRRPRVGRRPVLPTKAEIEEHFPLHLHYRPWCKHCRAGKARLAPHIVDPSDRERLGITFSADFAFLGPEEAEEDMQPSLVMYDDDKKAFWAAGVMSKEVTEPVVKLVKDILDQSGYVGQKLSFKTDQEASIVALKRAVAAARVGETVPIESPVRASKSNGMMESAIGIWQGQVRTIKHYTEDRMKRRIEVGSVLYSWLVPFCAEVMNKFKVGADGRTAYERITEHKCKNAMIGFAEAVDFILETDKGKRHKADSRVQQGIFLGYVWRTTEYLVGTEDTIYKCRTVRRRAEELAYDQSCIDFLKISYHDYVMKGARTAPAISFPLGGNPQRLEEIPTRGREFVPRKVYVKIGDYEKFGFTQGCRGCTWTQNRLGPRTPHNEVCKARMEKAIAEDVDDDRTRKAKESLDHYLAQQVEEGDVRQEREVDPRQDEPEPAVQEEERVNEPERFDIGSPVKNKEQDKDMQEEVELDEGPSNVSERRIRTPVRPVATKRRRGVHDEEPDTKKIIVGELTDDEDAVLSSIDDKKRKKDEEIVCRALLGKSLHEMYSNKRIDLAVKRQTVEMMKKEVGMNDVHGSAGKVLPKVDVSEIFSPERVGALCRDYGLKPGMSMDIKTGYDFDSKKDRDGIWESIMRDEPSLVIGSPPCTLCSRLQELNKYMYRDDRLWLLKVQERMSQAKRYVEFCAKIYNYQVENGRYFVHEHPWLAASWGLECIAKLERREDVVKVLTHMCQFGMTAPVGGKGSEVGPVLKPTGFMTNSLSIARELARVCPRNHKQVHLMGGRAADAAIYPPGLCKAICRGIAAQLHEDSTGSVKSLPMNESRLLSFSMACAQATGSCSPEQAMRIGNPRCLHGYPSVGGLLVGKPSLVSAHPSVGALLVGKTGGQTDDDRRPYRPAGVSHPIREWPETWSDFTHEFDGHGMGCKAEDRIGEEILQGELHSLYVQNGLEGAFDDVSGTHLDPSLVRAGRELEMKYFKDMKVYDRVPRSDQAKTGGKIIGTEWIDVNTGDIDNPKIRSRLVGKEFRTGPDDALFASTPPLEALRLVISRAATAGPGECRKEIMINDVSRAYFYAKCTRCLYVELPEEDPDAHPDFLGKLRLCLYGTRDAALNWHRLSPTTWSRPGS